MRLGTRAVLLCALPLLMLACDKKDQRIEKAIQDAKSNPDQPAPTQPTAAKPSAKVDLNAPRTVLPLQVLPFTVAVPPGWAVNTYTIGGQTLSMLEGPLIDDEAHITLSARDSISGELLKLLRERSEKETPQIQKEGGLRKIERKGDALVIETRRPVPDILPPDEAAPSTRPAATQANRPATAPTTQGAPFTWEWRVDLYVPSGVRHQHYAMTVLNLSPESYEKNKQLLEQIVDSLHYMAAPSAPF